MKSLNHLQYAIDYIAACRDSLYEKYNGDLDEIDKAIRGTYEFLDNIRLEKKDA